MKIKHLTLAILTSIFAVSCSNDDNAPDYSAKIAGNYKGTVNLSVGSTAYDEYPGQGKTLEIIRVNEDSIVAVLNVDYQGVEKVTAGAKVTYKNGVYTLTGGETVTPSNGTSVKASLTGEITEKGADIEFLFKPGAMPMNIKADFSSINLGGSVMVDATDYMKWTYFSFDKGVIGTYTIKLSTESVSEDGAIIHQSVGIVDANGIAVDENSLDWDIAIHRENIRINKGGALKTDKTVLADVTTIPTTGYTPDEDGRVIVDMSGMMSGGIKYASCKLSNVLGGWLSRTGMPPVYTIYKWVYIIQKEDGKYAKIQFTDRTNDEAVSGFISFTYEYPVE